MDHQTKTFEAVIVDILTYFKEQRKASDHCILGYKTVWNKLKAYLDLKQTNLLDANTCKAFLSYLFDDKDYSCLTVYERFHVMVIHDLIEYLYTGAVLRQKTEEDSPLEGSIGDLMTEYLQYRLSTRIAQQTAYMYKLYLSRFLAFLSSHNILTVDKINPQHIFSYIKDIKTVYDATIKRNLIVLKGFFRYLYEKDILPTNYSHLLPKNGYKNRSKLPSVFSELEIEQLLQVVDRGNAIGKRDYAILLLAAKLGLRASDIANLKFCQLLWNRNIIRINQLKTGEPLELPLLAELGNAIIDYIKYGRPDTDSPNVFIISVSPYAPLLATSIYTIVSKYFTQAKINTHKRKRGPHALRHSLAGQLLDRKTILPVISEVLGHKNTESTKYYLSIDLRSLRICALEVPPVATSFYLQKGGYFYE